VSVGEAAHEVRAPGERVRLGRVGGGEVPEGVEGEAGPGERLEMLERARELLDSVKDKS